jgi:hypothetical protein
MISFCSNPIVALWYAFSQDQTTQVQTIQEQTTQVQTTQEQTTQVQTTQVQTIQKQPILDTVLDEIRSVYEILAKPNFKTLKEARIEIRQVCKILLKVNAKINQELDEVSFETRRTLDMVLIKTRLALHTLANSHFETLNEARFKIREARSFLIKAFDITH